MYFQAPVLLKRGPFQGVKMIKASFAFLFMSAVIIFAAHKYYIDIEGPILASIGLVGTAASIIGLVMVLFQLAKIRGITESAKLSAEKTRNEMNQFLFISDLSKTIKTIEEIQQYNRNKKFEMSLLRMQELKSYLSQIINNDKIEVYIDLNGIKKKLTGISVDINSINKEVINNDDSLDILELNNSLELLHNQIIDLDSKLKKNFGGNDGN